MTSNIIKYHTKNPLYAFVNNKFIKDFVNIAKITNPLSILDVGCGEGFVTKHLSKTLTKSFITGIDFNKEAIKYAKNNSSNYNVKYLDGNLFKLKINQTFDLVTCSEVLEHLINYEHALEILIKLSNKYLLLSVPNEPWFRLANILRLKYLNSFGNTPGHVNNWRKKDLINLCNKYGKITKVKSSSFWNIILLEKTKRAQY